MKRTPLPPRTHPIPRSALKKRKRPASKQAAKFAREYGSVERVEWVKRQPCRVWPLLNCGGDIENAHTKSGGVARKADYTTIVPLCHRHHKELHMHGARTFELLYWLDLARCADATQASWVEQGGEA